MSDIYNCIKNAKAMIENHPMYVKQYGVLHPYTEDDGFNQLVRNFGLISRAFDQWIDWDVFDENGFADCGYSEYDEDGDPILGTMTNFLIDFPNNRFLIVLIDCEENKDLTVLNETIFFEVCQELYQFKNIENFLTPSDDEGVKYRLDPTKIAELRKFIPLIIGVNSWTVLSILDRDTESVMLENETRLNQINTNIQFNSNLVRACKIHLPSGKIIEI